MKGKVFGWRLLFQSISLEFQIGQAMSEAKWFCPLSLWRQLKIRTPQLASLPNWQALLRQTLKAGFHSQSSMQRHQKSLQRISIRCQSTLLKTHLLIRPQVVLWIINLFTNGFKFGQRRASYKRSNCNFNAQLSQIGYRLFFYLW